MKKSVALLLALVMVASLAACGSSAPAATPAAAPAADNSAADAAPAASGEIVINFLSTWVGSDAKAAGMSKLIESFNAENAGSIRVVVEEQTDYNAYCDRIRTAVTDGSVPDLCILDTSFDIKAYAVSDKFMDLTPYLNDGWGQNFSDGAFDAWSVDGKVSILPFEAAVFPLIYNTRIFEEIGWDHFPTTYDEFFQFCKDAKAKGYNATGQMAGDNAWSSMLWYSLIVEAIGGRDVYADGLQNPAFVEGAKLLKDMYKYTFDGAVSATANDVNEHWINRDTAIYLNGPDWIANLYKEVNSYGGVLLADDCDIAVNPGYEGGKGDGGLVTAVQGFLAAARQDDPAKEEAVVKFLKYLTDPAHVSELALSSGAMFFVKYDPAPEASVFSQKFTEIANRARFTVLHVNDAFPKAFSAAFPTAVQNLINGETDEQGFVDMLQTAINNAA